MPSQLDLIDGRYPDAVSLPSVLEKLGDTPQGQATLRKFFGRYERITGLKVSPEQAARVMATPARMLDILAVTPQQMSQGIDAMNLAHRAGTMDNIPPLPQRLPTTFDLASVASAPVEVPTPELKEVAPGLYTGSLPGNLDPAEAKANIVAAEVFTRLAGNPSAEEAFSLRYAGKTFTRVDDLLDALSADGHTVEVRRERRVADFAEFKTKTPTGEVLDVPAPLMLRTGVTDDAGREAVLPAVHSEMIISIRQGEKTQGPGLDADVCFFQGIDGTGFFPAGLWKTPSWLGLENTEPISGEKARDAVHLAALLGDVINVSARDQDLAVGGYGVTGVCNDTVAVVEHAVTGNVLGYALLMRNESVMSELQARLSKHNGADDADYARLKTSIAAVPSDIEGSATSASRALASIPWQPGAEPFQSTVDARAILQP